MAKTAMSATGFFNMYSHPWEYHERAAESRWKIPGYIVRHAGEAQRLRLKRLLASLAHSGSFETFSEYIEHISSAR